MAYLNGCNNPNVGYLCGLGASTNTAWVSKYQDPFNKNYLYPASAQGETDPAGAYAKLAPAFNQIKQDAVNFVNSFPAGPLRSDAQATIDGWKRDWPLIQGFLDKWRAALPADQAVLPAPVTLPQSTYQLPSGGTDVLQSIHLPSFAMNTPQTGLVAAPNIAPTYYGPQDTSGGSGGILGDWGEYLPWIIGAGLLGLVLSRRS